MMRCRLAMRITNEAKRRSISGYSGTSLLRWGSDRGRKTTDASYDTI